MQAIVYQNNTFLDIFIFKFVILRLYNSEFYRNLLVEVLIIKVKR